MTQAQVVEVFKELFFGPWVSKPDQTSPTILAAKPMASVEVILHRSALTMSSKLNILVQEGARRIRNCSPNLPWMTVQNFLNRLMK